MMRNTITKEQLEEIEDAMFLHDRETAYALLEEYAGIEARPYTAWAFYDEADNYVGNSDNDSIQDLLDSAYITIV
jgi:hypothetical protein